MMNARAVRMMVLTRLITAAAAGKGKEDEK